MQKHIDAVKYFHELLLSHPVVLFIDSLDQLTDSYLAGSRLSFLVGIKCHPDSRIIVSALPDDKDPITKRWGKYIHLCDTLLADLQVPRVIVKTFQVEEVQIVLSRMLSLYNRTLNESQIQNVMTSILYEPTAVYLSLAVNIVQQWTTADGQIDHQSRQKIDLKLGLQGTVNKLINQIFDRLELDYGKMLTRFAVGFILFSKTGYSIYLLFKTLIHNRNQ